jgi:ABC-2 type transport system ATP-binding protein
MIRVKGLSKRYGDLVAVRDVSFEVEKGEVIGFLGPNGAGKTTTMRVLTSFLSPSAGSVEVAGHDVSENPGGVRRATGYLPELPPLYPEMRVADYLRYTASLNDVPRRERKAKVARVLASCGLEDVERRVIGTLSKGYRQRVGLAQAIVHEPEVLIFDEPTSGLDPVQILEIRQLLRQLSEQEGRTIILSTHILAEVEAICDRVLIIAYGALRLDATLEQVQQSGSLEQVFLREVEAAGSAQEPEQAPA